MSKTAVYIRVSTVQQNTASQEREINRWLESHGVDDATWFIDKATGNNLKRPAFEKLQKAIFAADVDTVVLWKLDRLSRKLIDGLNILADWCDRGLRVVSVTQQIDFNGAMGKMLAAVLLGVAEMEQETRRERQLAGIQAAKAKGRKWGGSSKGWRSKETQAKAEAVRRLKADGMKVAEIARVVGLSRPTVYSLLRDAQ